MTACTPPLTRESLKAWDVTEPAPGRYLGLPLLSGQVLVSGSSKTMDIFVGLIPPEYTPYVHAGILSIEDGQPWVYEEIGDVRPTLKRQAPTHFIRGQVERTPLDQFLRRYFYVEVYAPAGVDPDALVAYARRHHERGTPFDAFFDYRDNEALYCTEFVALGLAEAGGTAPPVTPNRPNASVRVVLDWLGLPDGILYAESLVSGARRVATVSAFRTPREIVLLEAVKAELHRRYTCDQRLGHVFYWGGLSLKLRPPVKAFLDRGLALYADEELTPGPQQARDAVRALALEMLGPFEVPTECGGAGQPGPIIGARQHDL